MRRPWERNYSSPNMNDVVLTVLLHDQKLDDSNSKVCSRCKVRSHLLTFHKRKDGFDSICRYCKRAASKVAALTATELPEEKPCSKCRFTKPLRDFYTNRTKKTGLTSQCIECIKGNVLSYQHSMIDTNPGLYYERKRDNRHTYYHKNEGWLISSLRRQDKRREMGLL